MKIQNIGSNMSELTIGEISILFSYKTPVAGFHPDKGFFRTKTHYSVTTTKHINKYLGYAGTGNIIEVDQDWIDDLVK